MIEPSVEDFLNPLMEALETHGERVRLIMIDHITSMNGKVRAGPEVRKNGDTDESLTNRSAHVQPLEEIARCCKEKLPEVFRSGVRSGVS